MASKAFRLFVTNLPWTIGRNELRNYFSQYGFVSQCQVAFDKQTGLSKRFGFVKFGTSDGYYSATKQDIDHILEGNKLIIKPAEDYNNNNNNNNNHESLD